ncbi:TetR/AcrR family transcriptional regulator [Agromyces sp. ZXT2-6]|uniref:TetR/AcrR family transcriptional regulator n=1 Tax=Agromyces sp. ZXT2-6 TaxID=3461153 RepID=UPI004054FAF8
MSSPRAARNTLTRDRVMEGALALADRDGLEALTIRALAADLGVKPMAIYHYVASKDVLLDALVDRVFAEVPLPRADSDGWREQLADRSRAMRDLLARHRWALSVLETRAHPGPSTLAAHEAVLDVLRRAGFSVEASAHAFALLDAFVFGYALQESMLETAGLPDSPADLRAGMDLAAFPRIAEAAALYAASTDYVFASSFEIGLGVVLDGIAGFADRFPDRSST